MQLLKLTKNKIIDVSRFVALLPSNDDTNNYLLILEGSEEAIPIQDEDLDILTRYLENKQTTFTASKTEYTLKDLEKPHAVEVLKRRIARYESMSDAESAQAAEAWERFKQNIDADRPEGQKLYS